MNLNFLDKLDIQWQTFRVKRVYRKYRKNLTLLNNLWSSGILTRPEFEHWILLIVGKYNRQFTKILRLD